MAFPTTICLGDIHFPFCSTSALKASFSIIRKIKPKRVIQLGDLYDLYSYSRFARSQNIMTPQKEIENGRALAKAMWKEIRQIVPKAECYQLVGNHDERIMKKAMGLLPELEHLLNEVNHLWRFDGVWTQGAEREELVLDNVCFMHGYRKHGTHVTHNLMSTVVGHLHRGGVVYHRVKGQTLFELNCGFLADPSSVPLSYGKQKTFAQYTLGIGLIDEYGPRFIPLGDK